MPSTRLSSQRVQMWQERLRQTRSVYEKLGLLGTDRISVSRLLLEFYRGNHWGHRGHIWGDLADDELKVVNKIHEAQNTILAQTSSRDPKATLLPSSEDRQAIEAAPRAEVALNSDIRRLRFRRQWNSALRDHCAWPVGVVRHGFTPEEEFFRETRGRIYRMERFRPAEPDKPWIKRELMVNTYLPTDSESWDQELPWVAFRSLLTMDEIKANPNMSAPDGLVPTRSASHKRTRPDVLMDDQNPDLSDTVEVFTVYEAEEQTWFQIVMDGIDKPLRDQDSWPLDWGALPVNLLAVNEQSDTPFPLPLLEEMLPLQIERNELRTIMSALSKRIRRIIATDENAMEPEELEKLVNGESLAEFIKVTGNPNTALSQFTAGGFPMELITADSMLENDMREVVGISRMDLAQRINVESATEANRVAVGGEIQESRRETAFREFLEDSLRIFLRARAQIASVTEESEIFPIRAGAPASLLGQNFVSLQPGDLQRVSFNVEIEVGSTMPRNRQREAQLAAIDLQVAASDPSIYNVAFFANRYVESRGLPASKALRPEALQAAQAASNATLRRNLAPQEQGGRGGQNGQGGQAPGQGGGSSVDALVALARGGQG